MLETFHIKTYRLGAIRMYSMDKSLPTELTKSPPCCCSSSVVSRLFQSNKFAFILYVSLTLIIQSYTNLIVMVEASNGFNVPEVSNMLHPEIAYGKVVRNLLYGSNISDLPGKIPVRESIDENDESLTRSLASQSILASNGNDTDDSNLLSDEFSLRSELNLSSNQEISHFVKKRALKTGTTIVGCIAEDGKCVVLAADSRATEGTTVADKQCEKVHILAKNIWCCGAGTSADIDALVMRCRYTFMLKGMRYQSIGNFDRDDYEFHSMKFNQDDDGEKIQFLHNLPIASVSASCKFLRDELYRGQGHVGANLVLGGYEYAVNRALLVAIHPHGSMDLVQYTALGSGGLAAMAVLDSRYKDEMTLNEATQLVKDAVAAGISNDLGSGSQIDLCIINRDSVEYRRAVVAEEILPSQKASTQQKLNNLAVQGEENNVMGVNGFGSLPYKVKSSRVVTRNEDQLCMEQEIWMRNQLGICIDET